MHRCKNVPMWFLLSSNGQHMPQNWHRNWNGIILAPSNIAPISLWDNRNILHLQVTSRNYMHVSAKIWMWHQCERLILSWGSLIIVCRRKKRLSSIKVQNVMHISQESFLVFSFNISSYPPETSGEKEQRWLHLPASPQILRHASYTFWFTSTSNTHLVHCVYCNSFLSFQWPGVKTGR